MCTLLDIRPDPKKVRAVEEHPIPKQFGKFEPLLVQSCKAACLEFCCIIYTVNWDVLFKWTGVHQKAFDKHELKRKLSVEPLLIYPDFLKLFFVVAGDALIKAIGAVCKSQRRKTH